MLHLVLERQALKHLTRPGNKTSTYGPYGHRIRQTGAFGWRKITIREEGDRLAGNKETKKKDLFLNKSGSHGKTNTNEPEWICLTSQNSKKGGRRGTGL